MNILITGATSGIGRELAQDYHHEGHAVWAVGRNEAALEALQKLGLHTGRVDLSVRQKSLDFFSTLEYLDLAILNAGTCEYVDMLKFDSSLVSRVMRANVESMAISIEGVLPLLRGSQNGHLVAVGSSAAYLPLPRAEAYGASKAAVAYMIDTLRLALSKEKIQVSLVCPGFVKTPLTDRNDFPMPFRVTTGQASKAIRRGIGKGKLEIHFPKRFTYMLKALSWMARSVWCKLSRKMV